MGQLEDLRLFAQILDAGSISKAADQLGIAKSAISRRLGLLEARYQTQLIDRGPGHWRVTADGDELYRRLVPAIEQVDAIGADFVSGKADLSGPLSVSVPRDFGLAYLSGALNAFKQHYPQIQLTVDFDDRIVDLARENYDFAIRIAIGKDDWPGATRIATVNHALYASKSYLKRHGKPKQIDDLNNHHLLHYGHAKRATWSFGAGKKTTKVQFHPKLNSNSGLYLLDATRKGLGISRLPDFIARQAGDDNSLVPLLRDADNPKSGIFLIHHQNRMMNRRMRVFADAMKLACANGFDH